METSPVQIRLSIPFEIHVLISEEAKAREISTIELYQKFMKLGLLAVALEKESGYLIARDSNGDKKIIL